MAIKRHENYETHEAFPSLKKIAEESGLSKPTVVKCINGLVEKEYIFIIDKGGANKCARYKINPYKNFEMVSNKLLDDSRLDPMEKGIIICSLEYMLKDEKDHTGKIYYGDQDFCKRIGISYNTYKKYMKSLEAKGFLTTQNLNKRDRKTGLKINEKIFHLDELGQAIVFTLGKHEEDIKQIKSEYVRKSEIDKIIETKIKSMVINNNIID